MKVKHYIIILISVIASTALQAQNSDKRMNELIEERKQDNLKSTDTEIIRIQIYNGLSESKAQAIRSKFEGLFAYGTVLSYDNPEWKVQTGKFTSEIEAYRALEKIRVEFPGALKLKIKR